MRKTDKNSIIEELQKSYSMELETVMNYLANSINLDGVRAEEIKKALAADVAEELLHARQLGERIKQLGGQVAGSLDLKLEQKALQPPSDSTDVIAIIEGVLEAEDAAITEYNKIIRQCEGNDYVTQDLAVRLLSQEEAHRVLFEGFLKEYRKK
ncbi:MAG: rubrerythrin [Acidobacteria bacterium]|nr:MAG: rubrerythrin [Acidobacteriota bacterium]